MRIRQIHGTDNRLFALTETGIVYQLSEKMDDKTGTRTLYWESLDVEFEDKPNEKT